MPFEPNHAWLKEHIRDIPDFPKAGVTFKDITPLLADEKAFAYTVDAIAHQFDRAQIDKVLGIEARGFIVAAPLAYRFNAGADLDRRRRARHGWNGRRDRKLDRALWRKGRRYRDDHGTLVPRRAREDLGLRVHESDHLLTWDRGREG
jgi:hypothetical protein